MGKENYLLADVISEVPLNVAASSFDLPRWVFGLSDTEYQKCSKGHFGSGVSILPDGKRTSINVESVGGHLMVQHYIEEVSKKDHLKLISEKSDLWVYHILHVHPKVTWEMKLIPTSDNSCIFQNKITSEHPSIFIKIASILGLVAFFVKKHDDEETKIFAEKLLEVSAKTRSNNA